MDWKTFLATFGAIFLAELGDKTQLATLAFAASSRSFWNVFLGSSIALIVTSLIATLAGNALARYIPTRWVGIGAGALFTIIGVFLIIRNVR
jgi:putative Ca2+/H+ antiporter (TMEM165/GDT1 family)